MYIEAELKLILLGSVGPAIAYSVDRVVTKVWTIWRRSTGIWEVDPDSYVEPEAPIKLKQLARSNEIFQAGQFGALKMLAALTFITVGSGVGLIEKKISPLSYVCFSLGLAFLFGGKKDLKSSDEWSDPEKLFPDPNEREQWEQWRSESEKKRYEEFYKNLR